jgi:hypothetical protein
MKAIKRWLFILGIGKLSKQYMGLANEYERMVFLAEHFGKTGLDVREARQQAQSKILSFRFKVKG